MIAVFFYSFTKSAAKIQNYIHIRKHKVKLLIKNDILPINYAHLLVYSKYLLYLCAEFATRQEK